MKIYVVMESTARGAFLDRAFKNKKAAEKYARPTDFIETIELE